jgi:hypothetical protein
MEEKLSLSEMTQNAISQSVTPSRLTESKTRGFINKLLGAPKVKGPFHSELRPGECPHYLFRDQTNLVLPDEEDPYSDDRPNILGHTSALGVVVITNRRSLFFHGDQNHISLEHGDLKNIEYDDHRLGMNDMYLTTTDQTVGMHVSKVSSYYSEVPDVVAYIADVADIEEERNEFNFEFGSLDSMKNGLMDQLSKIDGLRNKIDITKVAYEAGTGAKIGLKRGKVTGLLGLVTFGGIEIYDQLSENDESDMSVGDLDHDETAEDIVKWQEVGKYSDYDGMELASGVLGAAISVDKQTSGSEVSRVLSDLDFDMVNKQLEAGNQNGAAMQVASEAVEAYSTELSWISDQKISDDDPSSVDHIE